MFRIFSFVSCLFFGSLLSLPAQGLLYERSPIRYTQRRPVDVIAHWSRTLPAGEPALDRSSAKAFLASVLDELEISPASQLLVFSQTSFQNKHIKGETPRALYFNEDHYIGFVQGGDLEVITTDPRLGMTFYTMSVPEPDSYRSPVIHRNPSCLACHAGSAQSDFPGLLALSVFPTGSGSQILRGTTHVVDDTQDLDKRWGGWYVTGRVDGPRHRGNVHYAQDAEDVDGITPKDRDLGAQLDRMSEVLDMTPYLEETSDVVSLLVFEHQVRAHNQISAAFGHSRIAIYADDDYMAGGELQPKTVAIFEEQADDLLDVMLFQDEADLSGHAIEGSPAFQSAFAANARRDENGRSLKDFELQSRIFRYRCSYMIYSKAFEYLPEQFKAVFFEKLDRVLSAEPRQDRFDHLDREERQAIREILQATLDQPFDS